MPINTLLNLHNITNTDQIPLVLSVADLGKILQIGHCSAYKLANSGQIRTFRIGKNIRIPRDALLEYLSAAS